MSVQLKPQRTRPAKTSIGKSAPAYQWEEVYVDPEILAGDQAGRHGQAVFYTFRVSALYTQSFQSSSWVIGDLTTAFPHHGLQTDADESNRALSQRLCEAHPAISTYEGIFGGAPHLNGLRISVADILEQLYLNGSIAAVQQIYSPDLSEDQIKEAIAYAQDFLESAISSSS